MKVFALFLAFLLCGCSQQSIPDDVSANGGTLVSSRSFLLKANDPNWIDAGPCDPANKYVIKIYADRIDEYDRLALGTARFCIQEFTSRLCVSVNGSATGFKLTQKLSHLDGADSYVGRVGYKISNSRPETSDTDYFVVKNELCASKGKHTLNPNRRQCDGDSHPIGHQAVINGQSSQRIWLQVLDEPGSYADNSGAYMAVVETHGASVAGNFFTELLDELITRVQDQVRLISKGFWENIVRGGRGIITAILVLYVIIIGIFVMLGATQISYAEFLGKIVKIAVIVALMQPGSYTFFSEYLCDLFTHGQTQMLNWISHQTHEANFQSTHLDYAALFRFVDVIGMLFSSKFAGFLVALFLWFPIGFVLGIMVVIAIFEYVIAVLQVVITYMICSVAVQFLIALGPLFIVMALFETTKSYLITWLKELVGFTFQPLVLFILVSLVSNMMYEMIKEMVGTEFVWSHLMEIYLQPFGRSSRLSIYDIYAFKPIGQFTHMFTTCMTFWILVRLMNAMCKLSKEVSAKIFGGISAGAAAGIAQSAGSSARAQLNKIGSKKEGKTQEKKADTAGTKASTPRTTPPRGRA